MTAALRLTDDKISRLLLCDFKEKTHRKSRICEDQKVNKISRLCLAQHHVLKKGISLLGN